MNPYERRVIHSALQADRYVETHSEGEEPFRKVVVTLKDGVKVRDSHNNNRRRYGNSRGGSRNSHFEKEPEDANKRPLSFWKPAVKQRSFSMLYNDTIAAIATGMTSSGIGIIRISGSDALLKRRKYSDLIKR